MRSIQTIAFRLLFSIVVVGCAGCSEDTDRFHIVRSYETLSRLPRGSSLIEVQKAAGDRGILQYRFLDDDRTERVGISLRLRHQANELFYHFVDDRLVRVTKRGEVLSRPYRNRLGYWSVKWVYEEPRHRAERMLNSFDLSQAEIVEIAKQYRGPRFVGPLVLASGIVFLLNPVAAIANESESRRRVESMELAEARSFAEFERKYDPFKFKLGMPLGVIRSLFGEPKSLHDLPDGRVVFVYRVSLKFSPKLHVVFRNEAIVEVYGGEFSLRWRIEDEPEMESDS